MELVAQGLVLPEYARSDLAWEETVTPRISPAFFLNYRYTPLTGHIDLPRMVFYRLTTGAAGSGGTALMALTRADGLIAFEVVAPVTVTTAFTGTNYSHMVEVPILQTANTNVQILPMPSFAMYPGDYLDFGWGGGFADYTVTLGSITVIHVPTGPARETEDANMQLLQTPILV